MWSCRTRTGFSATSSPRGISKDTPRRACTAAAPLPYERCIPVRGRNRHGAEQGPLAQAAGEEVAIRDRLGHGPGPGREPGFGQHAGGPEARRPGGPDGGPPSCPPSSRPAGAGWRPPSRPCPPREGLRGLQLAVEASVLGGLLVDVGAVAAIPSGRSTSRPTDRSGQRPGLCNTSVSGWPVMMFQRAYHLSSCPQPPQARLSSSRPAADGTKRRQPQTTEPRVDATRVKGVRITFSGAAHPNSAARTVCRLRPCTAQEGTPRNAWRGKGLGRSAGHGTHRQDGQVCCGRR